MRQKLLLLLLPFLLSACYFNEQVDADKIGVKLNEGRIESCVGPGVYSDGGFFADLKHVNIGTLTFDVQDPSVATKDTQIVGMLVTVQARRKSDCESVTNLLTNWPALTDDGQLQATISATTNEAIKVGVRGMTLEQLLNDRNGLSSAIIAALTEDAGKYSVEIVNVSIKDVDLDDQYEAQLKTNAQYTAKVEEAKRQAELALIEAQRNQQQAVAAAETERITQEQRALTLKAQLDAEKAQTAINIEIAQRAGAEIAAKNAIYLENPQAFELERMRLLQGVLGDKSVVYFVPEGSDLTLFLTQTGTPLVPVGKD